MRVLVLSDAHGMTRPVYDAIEAHPEARDIIYLGDGLRQLDDLEFIYPDRRFLFVRGNNDFGYDTPLDQLVEIGGVRIFAVHGHVEGVSGGIGPLVQKAKRFGAKVALFGHTHVAFTGYQDGITLLNPGSIARPRDGRAS